MRVIKDEMYYCGKSYSIDLSKEIATVRHWGLMDRDSNLLTPIKYLDSYYSGMFFEFGSLPEGSYCQDFRCGRMQVCVSHPTATSGQINLWGYIDTCGREIIKPQYRFCSYFKDSVAVVRDSLAYYLIDVYGNKLTAHGFTYINAQSYNYHHDCQPLYAVCDSTSHWGYIDNKGHTVIPFRYFDADPFSNGLARVKTGRREGMINAKGRVITEPFDRYNVIFSPAQDVTHNIYILHKNTGDDLPIDHSLDGCVVVQKEKHWGVIDRDGVIIIPIIYDSLEIRFGLLLPLARFFIRQNPIIR